MIDEARELYDAGLSLLGWSYRDGPKKPLHKWTDMQRKRMPWSFYESLFTHNPDANVGVITGVLSGLVIVDCDTEDAVDWAFDCLPKTPWIVSTGRGAQFGYATTDPTIRNRVDVFNAKDNPDEPRQIDIRGEGGYASAPPSLHKNGSYYRWFDETLTAMERMASLPTYNPTWLPEPQRKLALVRAPEQPVVQDRAFRRAKAWMARRDPAVAGSGGDTHTFITCATLLNDFGLDDAAAWELLEAWNATCLPPWSQAELQEKINSAKKSGSASRGSKADVRKPQAPKPSIDAWAARLDPDAPPPEEPDQEFEWSEVGNADALIHYFGKELLYCHPWRSWLTWKTFKWEKDNRGMAMHLMKQTTYKLEDKWARQSRANGKMRSALSIAGTHPSMTVLPEDFDVYPKLFNCQNGVVNLKTGQLTPHNREEKHSKASKIDYNPKATCPTWLSFLDSVFLRDQALIDYVQRLIGYTMTAEQEENVFIMCYGDGSNGKSTFAKVLLTIMGDYGKQAPHDLLIERRNPTHPTELAFLHGLRLAIATEVAEGSGFDIARMKHLTGEDVITARVMRGDFFDFEPTHTLWLMGNYKPRVNTVDFGTWRRMRLIPFEACFTGAARDRQMKNKLAAEIEGIFAWAVEGAKLWHEQGLQTPEAVERATKAYQAEENVFVAYIEERYNKTGRISCKVFREDYVVWCEDQGLKPLGARAMNDRMRQSGIERTKIAGNRYWVGIQLDQN